MLAFPCVLSPRRTGRLTATVCCAAVVSVTVLAFAASPGRAAVPHDLGFMASSVSCTSPSFCLATGRDGSATFNGSTWTRSAGAGLRVSCATPQFCVAASYQNAQVFNGRSWSRSSFHPAADIYAVSCASATFCVAGDSAGAAYSFDGTSWSAPVDVGTASSLTAVSCRTTAVCMAGDSSGDLFTFRAGVWSSGTRALTVGGVFMVSCPSATFCLALDYYSNAATFNGAQWTTKPPIDRDYLDSGSCGSPTFCQAFDIKGRALSFNGTSWRRGVIVGQGSNDGYPPQSVSCTAGGFCAAVEPNHHLAFTFHHGAWGTGVSFEATQSLLMRVLTGCRPATVRGLLRHAGCDAAGGFSSNTFAQFHAFRFTWSLRAHARTVVMTGHLVRDTAAPRSSAYGLVARLTGVGRRLLERAPHVTLTATASAWPADGSPPITVMRTSRY